MFSNGWRPVIVIVFAFFIYKAVMSNNLLDTFVPFNAFEAPTTLTASQWQQLNDKFSRLVQAVNTTSYQVSYQLENILDALQNILNSSGQGKFYVLSVEESKQFTLINVIIQDLETMAVMKFSRIDFLVDSIDPYKIQKVILTPDKTFLSSQNVNAKDALQPQMFRIQNPLNLFYPYRTSQNEMIITNDDTKEFEKLLKEKSVSLENMYNKLDSDGTINKSNLVPAEKLPKDIVGMPPLRPIGL